MFCVVVCFCWATIGLLWNLVVADSLTEGWVSVLVVLVFHAGVTLHDCLERQGPSSILVLREIGEPRLLTQSPIYWCWPFGSIVVAVV